MISYLSSFIWQTQEEQQADPKVLRQKYLVLVQIKDHKIRLKPINSGSNRKTIIPPYKRPIWKKKLIL